jgi:hypothetical protein
MRPKARTPLFVISLTMTLSAAAQTPQQAQLDRFQEKIRRDMTTIPNYTCLETIERAQRKPPLDFMPYGAAGSIERRRQGTVRQARRT